MKKVLKYVLLIGLLVGGFSFITQYYCLGADNRSAKNFEMLFFGLLGLILFAVFCDLENKIKTLWIKATVAAAWSAIYAAIVFVINNFWRYIDLKLQFDDAFSFEAVLKWDAAYTGGLGCFRYLILFAVMFAFCGFKIFISLPKSKAVLSEWKSAIYDRIYMDDESEDIDADDEMDFTDWFIDGEGQEDVKTLSGLNDVFPYTEEGKTKVMNMIDEDEWEFWIYLLFKRYGDMLTKEEYLKYRDMYIKANEEFIQKNRDRFPEKPNAKECLNPFADLEAKFVETNQE